MFLRWDAIRVVVKYLCNAIHMKKGFQNPIHVQWFTQLFTFLSNIFAIVYSNFNLNQSCME